MKLNVEFRIGNLRIELHSKLHQCPWQQEEEEEEVWKLHLEFPNSISLEWFYIGSVCMEKLSSLGELIEIDFQFTKIRIKASVHSAIVWMQILCFSLLNNLNRTALHKRLMGFVL